MASIASVASLAFLGDFGFGGICRGGFDSPICIIPPPPKAPLQMMPHAARKYKAQTELFCDHGSSAIHPLLQPQSVKGPFPRFTLQASIMRYLSTCAEEAVFSGFEYA